MRISILEEREDFYIILAKTLEGWEHLKSSPDIYSKSFFFSNKFLNFVAHPSLHWSAFSICRREYYYSPYFWRNLIQRYYVIIATSHFFRGLLSHKRIVLSNVYKSYLILGGNHRLRIFRRGLESCYVVLKSGESKKFIDNELSFKSQFNLSYAPIMISHGSNWIEEEVVFGVPLNRVHDSGLRSQLIDRISLVHVNELISKSKRVIKPDEFAKVREAQCIKAMDLAGLSIPETSKNTILKTFKLLQSQIDQADEICISWTHGDLQTGNVLISENSFKVIDWETVDERFWLYDLFVFIGELRLNGSIKKSLRLFSEKYPALFANNLDLSGNWKIFILIEELVFRVNEDCSYNFYHSGCQSVKLCEEILLVL